MFISEKCLVQDLYRNKNNVSL